MAEPVLSTKVLQPTPAPHVARSTASTAAGAAGALIGSMWQRFESHMTTPEDGNSSPRDIWTSNRDPIASNALFAGVASLSRPTVATASSTARPISTSTFVLSTAVLQPTPAPSLARPTAAPATQPTPAPRTTAPPVAAALQPAVATINDKHQNGLLEEWWTSDTPAPVATKEQTSHSLDESHDVHDYRQLMPDRRNTQEQCGHSLEDYFSRLSLKETPVTRPDIIPIPAPRMARTTTATASSMSPSLISSPTPIPRNYDTLLTPQDISKAIPYSSSAATSGCVMSSSICGSPTLVPTSVRPVTSTEYGTRPTTTAACPTTTCYDGVSRPAAASITTRSSTATTSSRLALNPDTTGPLSRMEREWLNSTAEPTRKTSPVLRDRCDHRLADSFSGLSLNERSSTSAQKYYYDAEDDDYYNCEPTGNAETPIYTLSVTDKRVVVFEPAREKFIESNRSGLSCRSIEENNIYHASSITRDRLGDLTVPTALTRKKYLERDAFVYGSADSYRESILPALLLGSRVRDFEQRCAVVDQIGTFVLTMPAQNRRLKELQLKTTTGTTFNIDVKFVKKGKEEELDKKWIVFCHPPKAPLPIEVRKGSMLEIMAGNSDQPRVTSALMRTYANKKAPIDNWPLLSAIYGARAKRDYPAVSTKPPLIRLAKNAGQVHLNPEQTEAVARYNCDVCPAFVVEAPPGSGKTVTAAAMAVSYRGQGVQLFLSTANVPVINMALALAKLDYGSLKAIHFISSEREELMTEETRSPFSVLSLAKTNEEVNEKISRLEAQVKLAPNEEEKDKLRNAIRKMCSYVYADKYDVFFATVDMILGRLFKNQGRNRVDDIKKQLMTSVRRIVVDEASQLTESALNALILCFPKAQIVLIGDSKQLPPFRYTPGDVVSELAARSSLEVIKGKMNLPVIKLKNVYRASPLLMAHYSDVFYEGGLVSRKPETFKNVLSCFGARSGGAKCLFWKVKGHQKQAGTSKINDGEIRELKSIINILRNSGYDEKDVMIISYYEAQRKKAEEELPEGYEVLTVDSAQGREKKIVIVLTTRTSVPTEKGAFFSCPLRCNVAVSRHQEALIVLGHTAIGSAPNWSRILSPKYFKHVPYNGNGKK